MNNVILIMEDNHGLIGVANNYYNAVKWLIENAWLNSFDDVYVEDNKWETIVDVFGENWEDLILNKWDRNKFNEVFQGSISLESTNVIGTEEEYWP